MIVISYIKPYKFARVCKLISRNIASYNNTFTCYRVHAIVRCVIVLLLPGMFLELFGLGSSRFDEYTMSWTITIIGIALVSTADAAKPKLALGTQRIGALCAIFQVSFVTQLNLGIGLAGSPLPSTQFLHALA